MSIENNQPFISVVIDDNGIMTVSYANYIGHTELSESIITMFAEDAEHLVESMIDGLERFRAQNLRFR